MPPKKPQEKSTSGKKSGQSSKAKTTTPRSKKMSKKLKTDHHEQQLVQVDDVNLPISSKQLEDLPSEMLVQILQRVDSHSLFTCRLVNLKWMEIASIILQSRDDSFVVKFKLYCNGIGEGRENYKNYVQRIGIVKTSKRTITEFIECYKNSKFFPFTRFEFGSCPSMNFNTTDVMSFFADMGSLVKCLTLNANFTSALIPLLRKLLLEQVPNLEALTFKDDYKEDYAENFSTVSLFPENNDNGPFKVVLPHLQRLTVGTRYYQYLQLTQDIIQAAPNLKVVNGPWRKEMEIRDIQFWFSIPKKLTTDQIGINPTTSLIKYWKNSVAEKTQELPECKKLRISASNTFYARTLLGSQTPPFINMMVELYKDKISSLELDPLGFLTGINWTNFGNIRQLCLSNYVRRWIKEGERVDFEAAFFPSDINKTNAFPMVEEIDFKLATPKVNFPTMGYMPKFPRARHAKIDGNSPKICIEKIAQMCPNLTKVELNFHAELSFPAVAQAIWKRMKKLRELTVTMDLRYTRHNFPAMDQGFTGYSGEVVELLWQRLQKGEDRDDVIAAIDRIPRKNPSILDAEELKKLSIKLTNPEVPSQLEKAVTDVSKIFAFDLLPDLEVSIERRAN